MRLRPCTRECEREKCGSRLEIAPRGGMQRGCCIVALSCGLSVYTQEHPCGIWNFLKPLGSEDEDADGSVCVHAG